MIIRLDEFPRCDNKTGARLFDPWGALDRFRKALDAPFLLAVVMVPRKQAKTKAKVRTWALEETVGVLRKMDGVHLAMHGIEHKPLSTLSDEDMKWLHGLFGNVAVPPHNLLDQGTVGRLGAAGYRYVCTGPETRTDTAELKYGSLREIPSVFYGELHSRYAEWDRDAAQFARWDCVTLHLCWEKWGSKGTFDGVKRFAARYRREIEDWPTFLKQNGAV